MTFPRKVAIVGAGPAGLFCAYELARNGAEVTVFDQGASGFERDCPDINCTACMFRRRCAILCGEGGAGGYSDGKVTLSTGRGVQAGSELDFHKYEAELQDVDDICTTFGPESRYFEPIERPSFLENSFFRFESFPLRFFGTDGIRKLIYNLRSHMEERYNVEFKFNTHVSDLLCPDNIEIGIVQSYPSHPYYNSPGLSMYDDVVLANGSYDSSFMRKLAASHNLVLDESGPAGIGIRLETESWLLEPLMAQFYDFKLYMEETYPDFGDVQFRSFCVNRDGSITNEQRMGSLVSINGRSETEPTGRSNLAILARIPDGKAWVRNAARHINTAANGLPMYQSAARFAHSQVYSTGGTYLAEDNVEEEFVPEDLLRANAFIGNLIGLFPATLASGFQKYLLEMERILPGVVEDRMSVVYAPEIKYHMPRWPLGEGFTVPGAPGLQVIGSAAGYTDSISTSAVMGLVAARYRIQHGD